MAEKSLKAFLRSQNTDMRTLKKLGHDLSKLYSRTHINPKLGRIERDIHVLSGIEMDVCYDNRDVSSRQAVNTFWAGLRVLSSCGCAVYGVNNFTIESFAGILSEARKYRLNLILAHQYLGQLDEDIKNATLTWFHVKSV